MKVLQQLSVGTKLWIAVALLITAIVGVIGLAGSRSAALTRESDALLGALAGKQAIASQWAAKSETAVARLQASILASDAKTEARYKDQVDAGLRDIDALQQRLNELPLDAEEQALFARIAELRQPVLAALQQARQLKADGDQAAAIDALFGPFDAALRPYADALQRFAGLQAVQLERAKADFAARRVANVSSAAAIAGAVVLAIVVGAFFLIRDIRGPLRRAVAFAESIADGDLTASLQTRRGDEFGAMIRALGGMRERLLGVVADVRRGTESISVASHEIAAGSQDLSARTEHTASNLQQTAASMEQMSSAIQQTAAAARQASELADAAGHSAQRGGQLMGEAVRSMDAMQSASARIADIIGVIDGIAFQTNILALNAAVEAARAGESGRGFAVVAGEVRNLAKRSAEAAREIKQLIQASSSQVDEGTARVNQAGSAMQEIVDGVVRVGRLIGEIATATADKADGLQQVNGAVNQLDALTQQNAALVEESAAAASSLSEQTERLTEVLQRFRLEPAGRSAV